MLSLLLYSKFNVDLLIPLWIIPAIRFSLILVTWGLFILTSKGILSSDSHEVNGVNVPEVRIIEWAFLLINLLNASPGSKHCTLNCI